MDTRKVGPKVNPSARDEEDSQRISVDGVPSGIMTAKS
jgi:hypothetical protein